MTKISVAFENGVQVTIQVRNDATHTTRALYANLPFESRAKTWGDEVYFSAPFHADREPDSRVEMEVGEVGFWPDGDAVAIFFGPTPASEGSEPRAAGPCNIIGSLLGDPRVLEGVRPGMRLRVSRAP